MAELLPIWRSSGLRLLERRDDGLYPSEDFLRAYLLRPELVPIEESCEAERRLHESLMAEPRQPITPVMLLRLKDPDARENYELFQTFRDLLLNSQSIEQAYLSLFADGSIRLPSLFIDQLAHVILASILIEERDPFQLRASECLFRSQKVTRTQGTLLAADEETLEQAKDTAGYGALGRLLVEAQAPLRTLELDVLTPDNAATYAARSGRFDMALDLTFGRPGLDALARVLERWIEHFYPVGARIQPVQMIRDQRWVWHIGMDTTASTLLNGLYNGTIDETGEQECLVSLFRLEVENAELMLEHVRGRPIYLGLAHDESGHMRLKPQNLLVNLPLAPHM